MNKIKPCPFCGTEVELSKNPLWQGGHGYYNCFEFEIVCPKCGCNVTYNENDTVYHTQEEAIQNVIKAWNKRDESNNTVTVDKIRAEIKAKIEEEEFARSVFRCEEKDTAKAEQCTGSIMAYNNVIKLLDKYKAEITDAIIKADRSEEE